MCTGRPHWEWRSAVTRDRRSTAESCSLPFRTGTSARTTPGTAARSGRLVDLSAEAEQSQGGEALRYLDVDTTPIPDDLGTQGRVVFVASYAGGVYALDEDRGAPVWKDEKAIGVTDLTLWREPAHRPNPGSSDFVPGGPLVAAREILLASSGASGLWALEPATGRTLWRVPIPDGGVTASSPVAGALLVGTTNYGAFLLSPRDGRPIDGFDLGSGFSQTPATYGNRGYVLSNAGTLVAVQVEPPGVGGQQPVWPW